MAPQRIPIIVLYDTLNILGHCSWTWLTIFFLRKATMAWDSVLPLLNVQNGVAVCCFQFRRLVSISCRRRRKSNWTAKRTEGDRFKMFGHSVERNQNGDPRSKTGTTTPQRQWICNWRPTEIQTAEEKRRTQRSALSFRIDNPLSKQDSTGIILWQ